MKKLPYLDINEEELLRDHVKLGQSEIQLILTNNRVFFINNSREITNSIKYNQIVKIQNSKPSDKEVSESTVSKIRIIDQKGIKTDFSFKGLESVNKSKKVTTLINKQRKECEKQNIKEDSEENQKSENKNEEKKIMTDNVLKANFLDQNLAAKKMYKDLVVEDKILTEDEFWNNFKSEIAEQKINYEKNGYIFEDENSEKKISAHHEKEENLDDASIQSEKNIPDLKNSIKMDQESLNNSEEFKSSISVEIPELPVFPDIEDETEPNPKSDEEKAEKEINENFVWYHEIIDPLTVDPNEFHKEADHFASQFETFCEGFNSLPEISLPPMETAVSIIDEISNVNNKRFNYQDTTDPEILNGLELLRKHKMEQQILLVHFWQNYPNIEDKHCLEKVLRLRNKIEELKEILDNEKKEISKKAYKALAPLYDEIKISMLKALQLDLSAKK